MKFAKDVGGLCEALYWAKDHNNGAQFRIWTQRSTTVSCPLHTFRELQDIVDAVKNGRQRSTIDSRAARIAVAYNLPVKAEGVGWRIG